MLVTGAKGYIGRHVGQGVDKGDEWPDSADVVVHLAGYSDASASLSNPTRCYEDNVGLTIDVIHRYPKAKFILASSAAVYGNQYGALHEELTCYPITPYGRSKLIAEGIVRDCCSNYVILRLFNVAGRGGNKHSLINMMMSGKLIIYKGIRDYVHIDDVTDAIQWAVDAPTNTYNICTGIGHSVNDVVQEFLISGRKLKTTNGIRQGDIAESVGDPEKAMKNGWHAKRSLSDILND